MSAHYSALRFSQARERTLAAEKDAAYAERNRVVAALSQCFPSWIGADPAEPDWFVVYIELPTGQVSWHFRGAERELVAHLREGGAGCVWDGHDTEEKYRRLAALGITCLACGDHR